MIGGMRPVRFILSAFAAIALSFAADVDGKWTAEIDTNDGPVRLTFQLKTSGEALSGTVASHMGESEIVEGKVNGDEMTFITFLERDGNRYRVSHKAKVSGSEMKVTTSVGERVFDYVAKKAS
jgi:hypothetical protein